MNGIFARSTGGEGPGYYGFRTHLVETLLYSCNILTYYNISGGKEYTTLPAVRNSYQAASWPVRATSAVPHVE